LPAEADLSPPSRAQRTHTQLVDLDADAGVRTKFVDDIPMDRSRIEVTGKLARYLVLRRGKQSRITGSTGNLKREPSTSSRCQATERYSSIIRCDPGLVEARRVARLAALSSCLSICVSATVIGSPVDGVNDKASVSVAAGWTESEQNARISYG